MLTPFTEYYILIDIEASKRNLTLPLPDTVKEILQIGNKY